MRFCCLPVRDAPLAVFPHCSWRRVEWRSFSAAVCVSVCWYWFLTGMMLSWSLSVLERHKPGCCLKPRMSLSETHRVCYLRSIWRKKLLNVTWQRILYCVPVFLEFIGAQGDLGWRWPQRSLSNLLLKVGQLWDQTRLLRAGTTHTLEDTKDETAQPFGAACATPWLTSWCGTFSLHPFSLPLIV